MPKVIPRTKIFRGKYFAKVYDKVYGTVDGNAITAARKIDLLKSTFQKVDYFRWCPGEECIILKVVLFDISMKNYNENNE